MGKERDWERKRLGILERLFRKTERESEIG